MGYIIDGDEKTYPCVIYCSPMEMFCVSVSHPELWVLRSLSSSTSLSIYLNLVDFSSEDDVINVVLRSD